jgi:type IX secretion system PorP/SprF family membrane protein
MKYLRITTILSMLIGFGGLYAQDIHFSQMRYSPLTLNPALAGAEQNLQAIVNYRDQWRSVAAPFQTVAASVDGRFKEKRGGNGVLSWGVNFFNDQAGDVRMTTTNANLNLGYHLFLDRNSTIGLALQGGFGQRGINLSNGTWSNQYVGGDFNTSLPSGENFDQTSFSHLDAGAGIVYHYKKNERYMRGNDQFTLTAGFSAFHVNRPSIGFLVGGQDDLAMRFAGFVYADYGIRNSNFSLAPAIYYNRQGPHQEILAGSYLRVLLNEGSKVTGFIQQLATSYGVFYRFGDALTAKFMLEYSSYSFGMAYDFNLSSLTPASNGRGGMEIFLRFVLPDPFGTASKTRIN